MSGEKSSVVSVRLPAAIIARLQLKASDLGVSVSDLIKFWVLQELNSPIGNQKELAAITIAALSPTLDLAKSRELVSKAFRMGGPNCA